MFLRVLAVATALLVSTSFAQRTEISVNGDFETGDLTGWQSFPSAANQIAVVPATGGGFELQIDNQQLASAALVKNNNLGAGFVMPGETIDISFEVRGTAAIGGVVFAELFSEIAGGGISRSELLGGAPIFPDPDPSVVTTVSFTTQLGPDVSGGVTLQLAAVTGGAAGSISSIIIDNVSVSVPRGTMPPPPTASTELSVNGDFETGDLTGWQEFPSAPGQINVVPAASGMGFELTIENRAAPSASLVKNNNLGAGVLVPGEAINIAFDLRGTTAIGGVVFAELFSEVAGGGISRSELLGGGPIFPNPDPSVVTRVSFSTVLGPDVSGGVTLQIAAITGAATGSEAVITIDNVSVSIPRAVASATVVGSGCGPTASGLALSATAPVLGSTLTLGLTGGSAAATGFVFYGPLDPMPLSLGFGCTSYLDLAAVQTLLPIATNAMGEWNFNLPIPNDPAITGFETSIQALLIPTASGLGADVSNAVTLFFAP